jgi:hypothetical protein
MNGQEKEEIRSVVKEAVASAVAEAVAAALKASNLIDGPTHLSHHQAIEEMLQARRHAYKAGITVIIGGLVSLLVMGVRSWLKE